MDNYFPEDWSLLPLEDCMEAIIDYRGKTPRKSTFGIPLITAKIVKDGRILEPNEFIPFEDYDERMQRGIPNAGDIVVTTEAPLGEVGQLDNRKLSVGQRLITLRGKDGLLDNTYLKFLMMSEYVQNQLVARATGTTVIGIKQKELRKVSLAIPPLPEQRTIAGILGALDDKIELNRRMNRTLESMARAVFRQRFVESEEVNDWDIGTVSDFTQVTSGKRPENRQEKADAEFKYPLFGGGGIMAYTNKVLYDFPILLTGRVGTLGIIFRITDPCWASDNTLVLISSNPEYYFYLYFYLKQTDLQMLNRGSTQPLLTQSDLQKIEMPLPPEKVLKEFTHVVSPMFAKIDANEKESRTLARLRDSLLPRLMRGEVRVSAL